MSCHSIVVDDPALGILQDEVFLAGGVGSHGIAFGVAAGGYRVHPIKETGDVLAWELG